MRKSTLKIDRYCPLVMQGFSNFFNYSVSEYPTPTQNYWWTPKHFCPTFFLGLGGEGKNTLFYSI